jgi:ATP-binding cassette, subfamily B, bacterial
MRNALTVALSLVWRAARRETITVIATQVVDAALLAVQLLLVRRILELLSAGGARFADFVPALIGVAAVALTRAMSRTFTVEAQFLIAELTQREAVVRVLQVAGGAEVADFERAEFHDRLRRVRTETSRHTWTAVWSIVSLCTQVLTAASMIAVLAAVAPQVLALGVLGLLPLFWARRRGNRLFYEVNVEQATRDRERDYLEQLLVDRSAAAELIGYGLGPHLVGRIRLLYDQRIVDLRRFIGRRLRLALFSSGVDGLVGAAALGLLVAVAVGGGLSVAEMGVAVLALQQVSNQLRGMVEVVAELDGASLFLEDFRAFEAEDHQRRAARQPLEAGPPLPPLHTLALDHVHFTYPGTERPVLHDIDVTLEAGEVVAVVGHNGSGKSTLAKLLAGLYQPTTGTIRWNGEDRAHTHPAAVRAAVAVVFQDFAHFELAAHDNIAFGAVDRLDDRAGAAEAAERAGAATFLRVLPLGFDTRLSRSYEHGAELSGGQWQRLAIARAFFRDAPVIVLDEPTAALDPRAEQELFRTLKSLCEHRTVVLISHRFSTVRSADRILVLDAGRLVEDGTHEELMALHGRYAEMFTLQAAPYAAQDGGPSL